MKSYTRCFDLSKLFSSLRSLMFCMFVMRMCCAAFLQSFSLQQYGVSSGRASIGSCTSLPPTQVFTTIGIYKGERVAIKKISKKKVSVEGNSFSVSKILLFECSFSTWLCECANEELKC